MTGRSALPLLIAAALAVTSAACAPNAKNSPLDQAPDRLQTPATATVNINTATAEELRRVPHIGESLAAAIISHRERFGPFRRPEYLMLVDGIGEERFRKIRHLIRTE